MNRKGVNRALLILLGVLIISRVVACYAEDKKSWYKIELIVFSQQKVATIEHWLSCPNLSFGAQRTVLKSLSEEDTESSSDGIDTVGIETPSIASEEDEESTSMKQPMVPFPLDDPQLMHARERLSRAQGYRIITNMRWYMQIDKAKKAVFIEQKGFFLNPNREDTFQGEFTFIKKNFLSLESKLLYQKTETECDPTNVEECDVEPQSYYLTAQSMDKLSSKLLYIDAPVFGVLVKAIPIENL